MPSIWPTTLGSDRLVPYWKVTPVMPVSGLNVGSIPPSRKMTE